MTQSSGGSAFIAAILKAKLLARQAVVKRDLNLRSRDIANIDESEYLFRASDLIAELRSIEGSHLTTKALQNNSEEGCRAFQESILNDSKVRADRSAQSAAEQGFNSFVPFPVASECELLRVYDSKQNRKVTHANVEKEAAKLRGSSKKIIGGCF